MLAQLTISNFAIVRELEIDLQRGMTAITGETGAGKSIAIDALGLCLGNRAEADMVRPGANRADICARFQLKKVPSAQQWLVDNHLDDQGECLLRRVISADGRSRGFINGTAVPLSQLRELGQLLIQIHGQHAHQLLLKPEHQRHLLDAYSNNQPLRQAMRTDYHAWHQSCRQLAALTQQVQDRAARRELLEYQLQELNKFSPVIDEYTQIDEEYKQLASSGQRMTLSQQIVHLVSEGDDVTLQSLINQSQQLLQELNSLDERLAPVSGMMDNASILLSEISDELRHYHEAIDLDPNRLQMLEQRIARYIALARKHHVAPDELYKLHQQLLDEHAQLENTEADIEQLSAEVAKHHQQALATAQRLFEERQLFAQELSGLITDSIQQLAMPHGQFKILVQHHPDKLTVEGADQIDFHVSANPGQALQALGKVVSGGELSRIALAIQVITARKMETPAMIFDEVDVGISGPTAAIVGQMLRKLGESTQVLCVTHLPQVAGCGHAHFFISKVTDGAMTETRMVNLDKPARLKELARLLGGSEVTRNTLANAKELLAA